MSFWLASRRTVQATDTIQRFDPRFWTVDFPRPAMASVVTTAPDALRVDAVFQKANDLIGLIWESELCRGDSDRRGGDTAVLGAFRRVFAARRGGSGLSV